MISKERTLQGLGGEANSWCSLVDVIMKDPQLKARYDRISQELAKDQCFSMWIIIHKVIEEMAEEIEGYKEEADFRATLNE